jgi:HD-GYP domain-containing protein (c-di-GMP phosphodiesterase class II)
VQLYQGIVDLLQDSMVKVCRGEPLHADGARGYVEAVLKQLDADSHSLMHVARYEKYDAFTFGHSIRVCFLALNFAKTLTQDPELLHRIGLAALLHDVGKAWVPFEILHATGYLTDEQRLEMNKHTLYGGEILLDMDHSDPLAVAVAVSHHRTQEGGGYPTTVQAARLSLGTRIVKICDVYEALTAVRPYKTRMSPTRAFRAMMAQQHHFDPSLLRRFIAHTGVYPQGSRVRLAGGAIARVLAQTGSLARPRVRLERAASGELLHPADMLELDLSEASGEARFQVAELAPDTVD